MIVETRRKHRIRQIANPILRIIFSRSMVMMLLFWLQVVGFFLIFAYFNVSSIYIMRYTYYTAAVIGIFVVIHLFSANENPMYRMTWLLILLTVPIFGVLLYLFIKLNIGHRWVSETLGTNINSTRQFLKKDADIYKSLENADCMVHMLSEYLYNAGGFPAYCGNEAQFYPSGRAARDAIIDALEKAEDFIFIEFFLVDDGNFWSDVLDVLQKKAREGVEVRFMYDGICQISRLPYYYHKTLFSKYGINARVYAPVRPFFTTDQNNRDHRKIVVVDGKCAFTGGINICDEYIGDRIRFGKWQDCAIKVEGDSVRTFTALFLHMWNAQKHPKEEEWGRYIEKTPKAGMCFTPNKGVFIPYGDGPYINETLAENTYMQLISMAKKRVYIATPYLIPDYELLKCMYIAARRGVKITILMPHIPDKKNVFRIARTFYDELIENGISIYEYIPGFVHTKLMIADDDKAIVGSINLDYRSLYLHFENGIFVYDHPVVKDMVSYYESMIAESVKIGHDFYSKLPLIQRVLGKMFRLLGPLL